MTLLVSRTNHSLDIRQSEKVAERSRDDTTFRDRGVSGCAGMASLYSNWDAFMRVEPYKEPYSRKRRGVPSTGATMHSNFHTSTADSEIDAQFHMRPREPEDVE